MTSQLKKSLEDIDPNQYNSCPPPTIKVEDDRTGMSLETLKRAFLDNLFYLQGKDRSNATLRDYYYALAYTVRDRLLHRFLKTVRTYNENNVKVVSYLSAEFLMGRHLANNL
ncbi:MAG: glycogen phosphorylase, partial [Xenococcus sp. MO_188.B8]|nr:glycogen phosphorylase [Xenococcus sp. MO_188.B8]